MTYVILLRTVSELEHSRQSLKESKAHTDSLNAQLLQQKERLVLQQNLARSLIFNVFPQKVPL